jgi:hypothetical protein
MKYHNKKTNGYDSKKEAMRALELKQMQKNGKIFELEEQVSFELIPKQVKDGKVLERACTYKADFAYYLKDSNFFYRELVVEDVKGMKTEVYRIKKKLMLHVHGIQIKEV